ncbi:MAG: hypothetical protein ACM3X9_06180 [Bacillota bacterium]
MSEIDLNSFNNSGQIFSHLLKNKTILTLFLDDGTKLTGRLLGWDNDFLVILYNKTLQIVAARKVNRLQAELENTPASEPPAISAPEIAKPKITPAPQQGNEIKDQLMAEKARIAERDNSPAKDRLDNLVQNL